MTNNQTLIIGGGIVGATLALKLAQAKIPVTLVDASPARDESEWQQVLSRRDARVYALSLASIELLKAVGAWQKVALSERKADYTQMQVWQLNGMGELLFGDVDDSTNSDNNDDNKADSAVDLLGSMVEPAVIEHALWQRLSAEDVCDYLTVMAGQKVVNMDWLGAQQGYRVKLEGGAAIEANNTSGRGWSRFFRT